MNDKIIKLDESKSEDIGQLLQLPYKSKVAKPKSDALDDVHIRFTRLVNYIGEVLLTSHLANKYDGSKIKKTFSINSKNRDKSTSSLKIIVHSDEWKNFSVNLQEKLFYSSIVQLSTIYEVFLSELMTEILRHNDEWLEKDERQITVKELFKCRNLTDARFKLIDRKILDFAMLSYPKKVERFEKEFHVGLHHKSFPLTLFQVHDFLEVRNIIVHNDGYSSEQYVERMGVYNQPPLLEKKQKLTVHFSWFLDFGQKLIFLCNLVDEQIDNKWTTSRNSS